jgi:putative heme-binding domain-containing protein
LAPVGIADRDAAVARYARLDPGKGDPGRGAAVFRATCASCHALGGEGHAVGPDLTIYRAKPLEDFVLAVVDPSRVIEPRFLAYEVQTRDGRTLTGVLKGETAAAFTLVQAGGNEETLLRQEVERWSASTVSLMPDGLDTALPGETMADLFAYVVKASPIP